METVTADWTFVMPVLPLCLPFLSHCGPAGLRGAGAPGSYWVRLPGTSSPSFLAPPLSLPKRQQQQQQQRQQKQNSCCSCSEGVYIFYQKLWNCNLFFKTQRGKEPCIICKQCIIGSVVQSLFYGGLSCPCCTKCLWTPHPHPHGRRLRGSDAVPPSASFTDSDQDPPLAPCLLPATAEVPSPCSRPSSRPLSAAFPLHSPPPTLGPAGPVSPKP